MTGAARASGNCTRPSTIASARLERGKQARIALNKMSPREPIAPNLAAVSPDWKSVGAQASNQSDPCSTLDFAQASSTSLEMMSDGCDKSGNIRRRRRSCPATNSERCAEENPYPYRSGSERFFRQKEMARPSDSTDQQAPVVAMNETAPVRLHRRHVSP